QLAPLRGDRRRLEQVLTNLLSNAIKFTPPGGAITVGARMVGSVTYQVSSITSERPTGAGEAYLVSREAYLANKDEEMQIRDTNNEIRDTNSALPRAFRPGQRRRHSARGDRRAVREISPDQQRQDIGAERHRPGTGHLQDDRAGPRRHDPGGKRRKPRRQIHHPATGGRRSKGCRVK